MDERQAAGLLREAEDILILTHRRPDGDTVGSAAGLCHALRQIGKRAYVLQNAETSGLFAPYLEGLTPPEGFTPGFVVSVDTASAEILSAEGKAYLGAVDLVIDHHGSNTGYGRANLVDSSCAACGEVIYRVILALGAEVTDEIAVPLYVAVSTDTGCFVYGNTKANTHRVAAALMDSGIDASALNKRHFRTKSLARLRLEAMILEGMHLYHDGVVAIACVPLSFMAKCGAGEEDAEDIAALIGQVEGVKVSATIREMREGGCKLSLRANQAILNASDTCAELGGGGHPAAAGCSVPGTLAEAEAAILQAIARHIKGQGN